MGVYVSDLSGSVAFRLAWNGSVYFRLLNDGPGHISTVVTYYMGSAGRQWEKFNLAPQNPINTPDFHPSGALCDPGALCETFEWVSSQAPFYDLGLFPGTGYTTMHLVITVFEYRQIGR